MKHKICTIFLLFIFINAFSNNGTTIFNNQILHEIRINSTNIYLFDSLEAHWSYPIDLGIYELTTVQIDGTIIDSCGASEKGGSSHWGATTDKKAFKINFSKYKKDQKYDGLDKINLSNAVYDPTSMHDPLYYKICGDAHLPAPRTSYAKLYLNNVYWGLYIIIEQPDKNFLETNFPDKNGNLYKPFYCTFSWIGNNKSQYTTSFAPSDQYLEQKTSHNGDTSYSDLINLFNKITFTSSTVFYDTINKYFDIESFLKYLAIDYLTDNVDNFIYNHHNFYLYHSTTDNRFHWIPFDCGFTYGCLYNQPADILWQSDPWHRGEPEFFIKCMQNPVIKEMYLSDICDLSNSITTNDHLNNYIDSVVTLITPSLTIDPNKLFSMSDFNYSIPDLKNRILQNKNRSINDLSANNYTCSTTDISEVALSDQDISLYPIPANNSIYIENKNQKNRIVNIRIYDIAGNLLLEKMPMESKVINIDISNYQPAIYLIAIYTNSEFYIKKVIKN